MTTDQTPSAPTNATMQVVGLSQYGGPEVLRPFRIPQPHPGPGQVRVRVRAAAVNPADVMLRDGTLTSWYEGSTPPHVPGMDLAGVIDEVGEDLDPATGLQVGDDVVAVIDNRGQRGAYSQYVVIDARSVAPRPTGATFVEAASFLMNALTAHTALDALSLGTASTVLVTGAAGAVGGYAVQLAAQAGHQVIAVAGEADADLVRSFGAQHVVPRGDGMLEGIRAIAPAGVDGLIDAAVLQGQVYPAVRDSGHTSAVIGGGDEPGRGITVHPINVRDHVTDHNTIQALARKVEDGQLARRVAATFPAEEAAGAHTLHAAGGLRGRVVLQF